MTKHKRIRWQYVVAVVLTCSLLVSSKPALAQSVSAGDSPCVSGQVSYYDAQIEPPAGAYDVFVQMGKRGQTASVTLYADEQTSGQCVTIGAANADSTSWQRLGLWQAPGTGTTRLQLDSEVFNSLPDANRPTVMLVPHANPPCMPTGDSCTTVVEGQAAYIEPTGTLLSEDTLHVTRVVNPAEDELVQVDYYADGQFLYSTPTLQPFDLRYVPGGDHTLSRVMQYTSKQQVVLQDKVYISFASDFRNLLLRLFNSNKVTLQVITGLAMVLGVGIIALTIIHTVHRRRLWKQQHGLVKESTPATVRPTATPIDYVPPPHYVAPQSPLIRKTRKLIPIFAIALAAMLVMILVDSYVVQIFRVEGESMEQTLQTDDKLLVSKVERTLSSLNNRQYVPRRGEVVIFHKARSDAFKKLLDPNEQDTYVVKRVIGLPGERVIMKDGTLTVFNTEHPEGFQPDAVGGWQATMVADGSESLDITLGTDEIFVIGDNRPGSLDSRTNGPIQVSELVGRARARFLPFSKRRLL